MMRFDLLNAFYPNDISSIQITRGNHRLIHLTLTTEDDLTPLILDSLLFTSNPDLYRSYLFTYSVVKPTQDQLDASRSLYSRQIVR